jgi:hypothetical protein
MVKWAIDGMRSDTHAMISSLAEASPAASRPRARPIRVWPVDSSIGFATENPTAGCRRPAHVHKADQQRGNPCGPSPEGVTSSTMAASNPGKPGVY